MITVRDVPAWPLIVHVRDKLKGMPELTPPPWALYVKTGIHREKPPVDPDWWWTRGASILRKLYVEGPVGTERLSSKYGGSRDRGSAPKRASQGSRSIIRELFQALERAGFVEKVPGKGRTLTPKGRSFLDRSAFEVHSGLSAKAST